MLSSETFSATHPEFVAEIVEVFPDCYPLTELGVIRHEPDNRLLECALAVGAEFIGTVNTAPGHFDRKRLVSVSEGWRARQDSNLRPSA